MKKQKILAFFLVTALMLSLGITALAADNDVSVSSTGSVSIPIPSDLKVPITSLTITPPSGIIVNPFGMEVQLPDTQTSQAGILSAPGSITNNSDIKMKVTATPLVSFKEGSTVKVSEDKDSLDELEGEAIFMNMAMSNVAVLSIVPDYNGTDKTNDYSNTTSAVFTKDTASSHNSCSIILDTTKNNRVDFPNSAYGVYLITGGSKGNNWKANLDCPTVSILFDIQPDLASS